MNIPTLDAARLAIAPYTLAIKIGALVVLLIAAGVLYWRITAWHEAYRTLGATETRLQKTSAKLNACTARESSAWQALREAEGKAKAKEATDRATAERIENELHAQLSAADARGRDLARRLQHYAARACPGAITVSQPAGAAGQPAQAAGEPGDPGGVGEATSAHLSACDRDATRLAGWIEWWAGVSAGR